MICLQFHYLYLRIKYNCNISPFSVLPLNPFTYSFPSLLNLQAPFLLIVIACMHLCVFKYIFKSITSSFCILPLICVFSQRFVRHGQSFGVFFHFKDHLSCSRFHEFPIGPFVELRAHRFLLMHFDISIGVVLVQVFTSHQRKFSL